MDGKHFENVAGGGAMGYAVVLLLSVMLLFPAFISSFSDLQCGRVYHYKYSINLDFQIAEIKTSDLT